MKRYLFLLLFLLPVPLLSQNLDTIPWQDMELSEKPFVGTAEDEMDLATKPKVEDYWDDLSLTGPSYKDTKKFPWWALTPIAVVPPILWVILDEDEPDPPDPVTPPDIECQPPVTLSWGQELPGPDINSVTVDSDCPDGFTITHLGDQNNGGTGCAGNPLIYTRTYQVADACGNTVSCEQTFSYLTDEEAPVLACPVDVTVECDQTDDLSLTGQPLATDNCTPEDQITLSYEDDETGLTDCGGTGVLLRTWTATDLCGNTSTCSQQITVVDLTAPILNCPPPITVNCGEETVLSITGEATATDNCTENITITYEDNLGGFSECEGVIIRTWTATDECGNETVCEQEITVNAVDCPFEINIAVQFADCGQANGAIATAIIPPGSYEYIWSNGETGTDLNNIPSGLYTVSITDINGNCTEFLEVQVDETPPAYIEILQVNPGSCLECGDIIIDLDGIGPFDLTLNGPVTLNLTDLPSGNFNFGNITCLDPGSYTIEVTDLGPGGNCTDIVEVEVPFGQELELFVIATTPPSSPGAMDGSIQLFISPPGLGVPAAVIVNGVFDSEVFTNDFTLSNLGEGTYTIWVIGSQSGCESNQVVVELVSGPMVFLPISSYVRPNPIADLPVWQQWHEENFDPVTTKEYLQDWLVEHPAPTISDQMEYQFNLPVVLAGGVMLRDDWQLDINLATVEGSAQTAFYLPGNEEGKLTSRFRVHQLNAGLRKPLLENDKQLRPYIGLGLNWNQLTRSDSQVSMNQQLATLADRAKDEFWNIYFISGVSWSPSEQWQINLEAGGLQEYKGVGLQYRF